LSKTTVINRRARLLFGIGFVLIALALPATASAKFVTGIDANGLFTTNARDSWLDTTRDLNAGMVRIDVHWATHVSGPPANPADPADPAYNFSDLDAAIQAATARNLKVMLTFYGAPRYAETSLPSGDFNEGAWKPDPAAFGQFVQAVAIRYSGEFQGLPRVRYYEAWNEPNLFRYIDPQSEGGKNASVDRYRRMLNAAYAAAKAVHGDNEIIAGSTAPYGDDDGQLRTHPLTFLRGLLCLNRSLHKTSCAAKAKFDILSHHPINLSGPPRQSAINRDDSSSADLKHVAKILRAAEKRKTITKAGKHHPLWATEYWWESYPDHGAAAIPGLKKHGLWIEEALYLFWKGGADAAFYFGLQDEPYDPQHPDRSLQFGLYKSNGKPKPAARAFRFPFVTERKGKKKVKAWGKAPASGKLRIERKSGKHWRKIDSEKVKSGEVFTAKLSFRGKATLRARVSGQTSLTWPQGKKIDKTIEVGKSKIATRPSGPTALREAVSPTP
jgi:hypothetical protein